MLSSVSFERLLAHRANQEHEHVQVMSIAGPYPALEHFDARSVSPWGENGRLTMMYRRWVQGKEAQARALASAGQPSFRLAAGLQNRLIAFLKGEEIAIVERHEVLAESRRALQPRGLFDDEAFAKMMADDRMASLLLAEMKYVRHRRELTYLSEYSRMHDPNFSMYSWMMARRQSYEPLRSDQYEINQFNGEHAGLYAPMAAFIWEEEKLVLTEWY